MDIRIDLSSKSPYERELMEALTRHAADIKSVEREGGEAGGYDLWDGILVELRPHTSIWSALDLTSDILNNENLNRFERCDGVNIILRFWYDES